LAIGYSPDEHAILALALHLRNGAFESGLRMEGGMALIETAKLHQSNIQKN